MRAVLLLFLVACRKGARELKHEKQQTGKQKHDCAHMKRRGREDRTEEDSNHFGYYRGAYIHTGSFVLYIRYSTNQSKVCREGNSVESKGRRTWGESHLTR